jgi:hypothetical protein
MGSLAILALVGWIDIGWIKELKVSDSGLYIQGNDVSTVDLKQRGKTRDFYLTIERFGAIK